ncbi:hypothetical protein DAEQUDRAFT_722267 [Daedalea quercina L-15889]|uniref:GCN5-related N-acetyltransferase Rv2170-like domain-containing protein n=1 Tax=Daedalea quercina L-15889 TaxID=1314783 RepID=A0A165TAB4_9APHY|nr:hypothetical protein DAEQUDRAFT_722267 [Daedalea quercina L-15889]
MTGVLSLLRVEECDYPRLHALLSPFLPESLTILGTYEQHRDQPFNLPVWASFYLREPHPPLFAVFTLGFASAGHQSRFFCSAESSPDQLTPEQEAFVMAFIETSLRTAFGYLAKTSPVGQTTQQSELLIGSIHEKWHNCLRTLPFAKLRTPCRKVLLPPSAVQAFAQGAQDERLPQDARVTQLEEGDLEAVVGGSDIARPTGYVNSRLEQSLCIRAQGLDGKEIPAAWIIVHSDSSLGMLEVVKAFRRRGLGGELMRRIVALRVARAEQRAKHAPHEPKDMTEGWNMVDVREGNARGAGFYGNLEGWKHAWLCRWATFTAPDLSTDSRCRTNAGGPRIFWT